jgi:hypothetical protein
MSPLPTPIKVRIHTYCAIVAVGVWLLLASHHTVLI